MSDTALSLCNMNGNGISGYGSFAFHAFIDGSSPISSKVFLKLVR